MDLRMPTRVRWAAAGGAVLGLLVVGWVLFEGHAALSPARYTTNFYDLQGRAMLHGRLDVRPAEAVGIEAFDIDGKSYVYFGPVPSLLRLPVLAATDRFDGRLGQPSMLLALIVLAIALARLGWVGRLAVAEVTEPGRRDALATGVWVFLGLTATVVPYLTSLPLAYHEAILWGLTFATLGYDALIRLVIEPAPSRVVWASVWAAAAFLTRASVGMGPVIALGFISIWFAWQWLRDRRSPPRADSETRCPPRKIVVSSAVGTMAVIGLYVAVNLAKFSTLFRLPLDKQVYSSINAARKAAMANNGGSLFGLKFAPTALWQYLRPDAVRITGWSPWVDFGPRATVIGGVTFDTISRSASVTATSPLFVALAVVGVVLLVRRRGALLAAWWAPIVGATIGFVATLTIAFVAHRYIGDVVPLLLLVGVAGWWWMWGALRGRRAWGWVIVGLVAVWSIVGNVGLAVLQQRGYSARTPRELATFVEHQLGTPASPRVVRTADATKRPAATPSQRLWIVGDCDRLYWSDGETWNLVEGGGFRVPVPKGESLALGPRATIERAGDRLVVRGDGFTGSIIVGDEDATEVWVHQDIVNDAVRFVAHDQVVLSLDGASLDRTPLARESLLPTPVCRELQRRGGSSS